MDEASGSYRDNSCASSTLHGRRSPGHTLKNLPMITNTPNIDEVDNRSPCRVTVSSSDMSGDHVLSNAIASVGLRSPKSNDQPFDERYLRPTSPRTPKSPMMSQRNQLTFSNDKENGEKRTFDSGTGARTSPHHPLSPIVTFSPVTRPSTISEVKEQPKGAIPSSMRILNNRAKDEIRDSAAGQPKYGHGREGSTSPWLTDTPINSSRATTEKMSSAGGMSTSGSIFTYSFTDDSLDETDGKSVGGESPGSPGADSIRSKQDKRPSPASTGEVVSERGREKKKLIRVEYVHVITYRISDLMQARAALAAGTDISALLTGQQLRSTNSAAHPSIGERIPSTGSDTAAATARPGIDGQPTTSTELASDKLKKKGHSGSNGGRAIRNFLASMSPAVRRRRRNQSRESRSSTSESSGTAGHVESVTSPLQPTVTNNGNNGCWPAGVKNSDGWKAASDR